MALNDLNSISMEKWFWWTGFWWLLLVIILALRMVSISVSGNLNLFSKSPNYKDAPQEFADYHRLIRIPVDRQSPAYPSNYKIVELQKAISRSAVKGARLAKLDWVERGPANVPGRTRGLLVFSDDPERNTWLAGSVGGGIWKTKNGGQTWINKTPELPNLAT